MRMSVLILAIPLAGCGIAAKVDARNDYQASVAAYKACLSANPSTPKACDGQRLAMEADERKFGHMADGVAQSDINVRVFNR